MMMTPQREPSWSARKSPREKCYYEEYQRFSETMRKVDSYANDRKKKCFTTTKQCEIKLEGTPRHAVFT